MRLSLIIISILFPLSPLLAEQSAQIDIEANFKPAQVLGLILNNNGTTQVSNITWSVIKPGTVTVKVPLTQASVKAESFVTAMVIGPNGEIALGPTKATSATETLDSILSIPECPKKPLSPGLETKAGQLQQLLETRSLRREIFQKKISNKLTGDFLEKVRTLEKGFGLTRAEPISPNLHPLELSDRLSRLAAAIRNYRRQQSSPSPTSPPA